MSAVRSFDAPMLELFRWMSERYVAPLAAVIGRAVPPRVAGEESERGKPADASTVDPARPSTLVRGYTNGPELDDALSGGSGAFVLRTAPGDDAALAVGCVASTLAGGRSAIVVVPEVDPLPFTVAALLDAFGPRVARFFGGDKRARYRMWLDIAAGRYPVVVGTRPAVFAPVSDVGLVYVAREHHALHREERAPYYHVRDVALARARIASAVGVVASVAPSLEASAVEHVEVSPRGRRFPPVEVVRPGPEGRAPRLVRALGAARRAFLYEPMRGYGVARVCRVCGELAACAACGGPLRSERGTIRCTVCEASGRCAKCGAVDFGIARGGAERVEEWARGMARVPVSRVGPDDPPRAPAEEEVLVGGIDAVKDLGPLGLDLVAILGADRSLARPGVTARERTLSAWMEAASWAWPRGRVVIQTEHPNDPAVQALVTGRPERFRRDELPRLSQGGFPVGHPVFRVAGTEELEAALLELPHRTLLVSSLEGATVCLVALEPQELAAFGLAMRRLAERGVVTRVEAEPHL